MYIRKGNQFVVNIALLYYFLSDKSILNNAVTRDVAILKFSWKEEANSSKNILKIRYRQTNLCVIYYKDWNNVKVMIKAF